MQLTVGNLRKIDPEIQQSRAKMLIKNVAVDVSIVSCIDLTH